MKRFKFEKGSMNLPKKILGVVLILCGASLIIYPDVIVPLLCGNKELFGVFLVVTGYFLAIAGRGKK